MQWALCPMNMTQNWKSKCGQSKFNFNERIYLNIHFRHDKLKGMAAHEELSDETARQMVFELETAYNAFQRFLRSN